MRRRLRRKSFLRLILQDQVEAFYSPAPRIGLFQDLFPNIERRLHANKAERALSIWHASKYAEAYVHTVKNGGFVYPFDESNIHNYMRAVGLDPLDENMDATTPVGLGNVIGKKVTDWVAANDGLKKDMMFVDKEGLKRIQTRHPNPTWAHWDPLLAGHGRWQGMRPGIVTLQTFVSPSNGISSYMYGNETNLVALGFNDVAVLDMSQEAYVRRANELLAITTQLTNYQKGVAELANNKIWGSLFMIIPGKTMLKNKLNLSVAEYEKMYDDYSYVTSMCELGATHAAWRSKRQYYAGRPTTVIPKLATRNSTFAAQWGDKATNFMSYIVPGDHPEYISGSSVIYSGFVTAADHWFAHNFPANFTMVDGQKFSDKTGEVSLTFPKNSWDWSMGPAEELTVKYPSLWAWVEDLPTARMYGGVHFREAGVEGVKLGKKVGKQCFDIMQRLKQGDMTATWPWPGRQPVGAFAN